MENKENEWIDWWITFTPAVSYNNGDKTWPIKVSWSVAGLNALSDSPNKEGVEEMRAYCEEALSKNLLKSMKLDEAVYLSAYMIDKTDCIRWMRAAHEDAVSRGWAEWDNALTMYVPSAKLMPKKITVMGFSKKEGGKMCNNIDSVQVGRKNASVRNATLNLYKVEGGMEPLYKITGVM